MADPRDDEDDTLELTPDMEADDQGDGTDDDQDNGDDTDAAEPDDEGGEEETVISFADDADPDADKPDDSSVIRGLRQQLRDAKKRAAEAEKATVKPTVELGPEPDFERDGDKYGYDHDAWFEDWKKWKATEATVKVDQAKAEERDRAAQESWQQDFGAYQASKVTLGVPDFDEAEDAVRSALSQNQQTAIIKAASKPDAFIYALGNSEAKLAELAKIEDLIKFAAAVARMEGAIKVVKRRKAPDPEKIERGSGSTTPVKADAQLEKLEKEAERSGDRTKVVAFKKAQEARGKAK